MDTTHENNTGWWLPQKDKPKPEPVEAPKQSEPPPIYSPGDAALNG